jgi:hypothetical protein
MDFERQGEKFIQFRDKYSKLIKNSNIRNIGIVEGFTGETDLNLKAVNEIEKAQLRKLEVKFNRDLSLYQQKYRQYLDQLMGRQRGSSNFKDKVISYKNPQGETEKYFVQQSGKLRKFTPNAWDKKGSNCGTPQSINTQKFVNLQSNGMGADMMPSERCKSGGYSAKIKNGQGDAYAWIDSDGRKNLFDDAANTHPSCPTNYVSLTKNEFDSIPDSGVSMSATSICDKGTLDSPLADQLKVINNRLMDYSEEMKKIINKMKLNDKEIENNVDDQRGKLMEKAKEINNRRKKVILAEQRNNSLRGELENKISTSESINIKNIAWITAGVTFIVYASHKISKNY